MESFLKKIITGKSDEDCHRYLIRFGKGDYRRRFVISLSKGNKIKIRGSFEYANDLVNFVKENKDIKFTGNILIKEKKNDMPFKKKAGVFIYEVQESGIEEFENAYFYLLNANSNSIVLKIKKSLPKPGKSEEKIDDKFCSLDLDLSYWPKIKEAFFWDLPECKKAKLEHTLKITDIILPEGESDPAKLREFAKRKGIITRSIICDGKELQNEYSFEA